MQSFWATYLLPVLLVAMTGGLITSAITWWRAPRLERRAELSVGIEMQRAENELIGLAQSMAREMLEDTRRELEISNTRHMATLDLQNARHRDELERRGALYEQRLDDLLTYLERVERAMRAAGVEVPAPSGAWWAAPVDRVDRGTDA